MKIGKFLFVWQFSQVESGKLVSDVLQQATDLNLGMVAIKIADGAAASGASASDTKLNFYVDAFHKKGIQVWGWQYLYGGRRFNKVTGLFEENTYSTPEREATAAVSLTSKFGLDGYIMDPEREYKTAPKGRAERFVRLVRNGLGTLPIALCSYRFPLYHRELPWMEFLSKTDIHMPQVYWGQGAKGDGLMSDGRYLAQVELDESIKQLKALANLPFLPAGRAYIGDGHSNPRPSEITAFLSHSANLGHEGYGLWNWDSLRPSYPGSGPRLEAIRNFQSTPPAEGITCPNCKTFIPLIKN